MNKNIIAALSAAIVVGAVGSAFAAPVVTLKGSVEGKVAYQQKTVDAWKGSKGTNQIILNSEINAGDKIKAVVTLKGQDTGAALMSNSTGTNFALGIDKAYLQTKGGFWKGGQELTTTIGDFDAVYSPYIANVTGQEGVKIEGAHVGPVNMEGFYGFTHVNVYDDPATLLVNEYAATPAVYGAKMSTKIAGLDMVGVGLRHGTAIDAHGKAGFSPYKGIDMTANYAMTQAASGASIKDAMMLEGKAAMTPAVTLRGSYRNFDADFAPVYMERNDDNTTVGEANVGEKGFHAGADLKVASVNGSLDWDQPENWMEGKADTKLAGFGLTSRVKAVNYKYSDSTFGVTRELPLSGLKVATSYTLDHNAAAQSFIHTAKASTTVKVLSLENVGLAAEGTYNMATKAKTYSVSSTYTAPNGIVLGAGYASDKGLNANAGMKLEF